MANSTKSKVSRHQRKSASRKPKKPVKPSKDFPLFAHNNGQWAKKVRGQILYFGPWDDPDAALQRWVDEKDERLAGRTPRTKSDDLTIKELADRFLTSKHAKIQSGELSVLTYRDYVAVLQQVADVFGKHRLVADLQSDDFRELRSEFWRTHKAVRVAKDVILTRAMFKWGREDGLIKEPVQFGADFKVPSDRAIREAKRENGRKDFTAEEVATLIKAASNPLRSMILLAINAGLGQQDLACLEQSHIAGNVLEFPRQKTGAERRSILWPETIEALSGLDRHKAKEPADKNCVFLTRQGTRFVRCTGKSRTDLIASRFKRLMKAAGINDDSRRGFYGLRHSFRTAADSVRDQPAINLVMGHKDNSMAANYRHGIDDERLQAVADTVRIWLWPEIDDDAR